MGITYKCGRCGYTFEAEELYRYSRYYVRCPRCGYEIIYKVARSYRIVKAT